MDEGDYEAHLEARAPKAGTKIYRGHKGGEGEGTVGIHWSTSRHVAEGLNWEGGGLHEATIEDPEGQVVPWGVLQTGQFNKGDTEVRRNPHDGGRAMGFAQENEVRLRPGAKIKIAGSDEPQTVDVGDTSISNYTNLHKYAVPGTPQHAAAENKAWTGPLVQEALFDPASDMETGRNIGFVPNDRMLTGNFRERMHQHSENVNALGEKHGVEDVWVDSGEVKIPAQRGSRD